MIPSLWDHLVFLNNLGNKASLLLVKVTKNIKMVQLWTKIRQKVKKKCQSRGCQKVVKLILLWLTLGPVGVS